MAFYSSFIRTAVLSAMVVLPCTAIAAWKRTYSYGSQAPIAGFDVSFIDDSAMPLKTLTNVTVHVDNRSISGSYAKVRCCKRDRAGAATPAFACASFTNGATGTGVATISLAGAALDLCKDTAGTGFPFLNLGVGGGGNAENMYLAGTVTEGS